MDINTAQYLREGTSLYHGVYRIEKTLGQGGFGITYLATDVNLEMKVAIKEFFPENFCYRDTDTSHVNLGTAGSHEFIERLKQKFLKEARNIAKLNYPGIIRIHAAFEENATAYYVMDYIDGCTLSDMVRQNGPLSESKALVYINKVGKALEYIHNRKMNHLDVKPANIMVRRTDDTPVIIDFGLSKQYDSTGMQTSTTLTGLSHGYAPFEQYNEGGVREFSPQTDIYSLAATLYYLLTGVVPPPAPRLIDEDLTFPQGFPAALEAPITKAMSTARKNRQSTIGEFLAELNNTDTVKESINGNIDHSRQKETSTSNTIDNKDLNRETVIVNNGDATRINIPFVQGEQHKQEPPRKLKDSTWWKNKKTYKILGIAGCAAILIVAIIMFAIELSLHVTVSGPSGTVNGYNYVDLGLPSGTLWATHNLGAYSPDEYGDYYAWAETESRASGFDWESAPYYQYMDSLNYFHWGKYNNSDGKTILDSEDDAATMTLGSPWRIPTDDEMKELLNECTWIWGRMKWNKGYKVIGPNGNSIFLPAAGWYNDNVCESENKDGNYWTSVHKSNSENINAEDFACGLYFYAKITGQADDFARCRGHSIRPVLSPLYVDLGLSVKWATCNLGASSPEQYGNYYAWAETQPRTGNEWDYNWYNAPYCLDSYGDSLSKYNGYDGRTILDAEDDAATVALGAPWRMPTKDEIKELTDRCTWTWTTMNGNNGYEVTGPNGNSIFLPAAGYRDGSSLRYAGTYAHYWSNLYDTSNPDDAYYLLIRSDDYHQPYSYDRYLGHSIRPVYP